MDNQPSCTTCDLCKLRAAGLPIPKYDPMRHVTPSDTRPKVKITKELLGRTIAALSRTTGELYGAVDVGAELAIVKELEALR